MRDDVVASQMRQAYHSVRAAKTSIEDLKYQIRRLIASLEECIERAEVCMELMGRKAEVPPFVMECAMLVNDLENLDFESHDIEATLTSLMSELQVEPYEDEPF